MSEKNYDLTKGGVKFDQDKPEWSLLPLQSCLTGVVRVLMYGAKKYTRDNWRAGMPWLRVLDAAKRHIIAWEEREDLDKETQLNHIDHALCELLFLRYYIEHGVGTDDRFAKPNDKVVITKENIDQLMQKYLKPRPSKQKYYENDIISDFSHEDAEGDPNYWHNDATGRDDEQMP